MVLIKVFIIYYFNLLYKYVVTVDFDLLSLECIFYMEVWNEEHGGESDQINMSNGCQFHQMHQVLNLSLIGRISVWHTPVAPYPPSHVQLCSSD